MQRSFKLSFCSIMSSLSTVAMILTGIIPIGTYALPAIAGVLLLPIIIEFGCKPSIYAYITTALLCTVLAADKEAVVLFILFFGYYPIVKSKLAKIKFKFLQLLLKLLIFNVTIILSYLIAIKVLLVPQEALVIAGISLPYVLLIFGNIVFLMYDYCINLIAIMYVFKIRPILHFPRQ